MANTTTVTRFRKPSTLVIHSEYGRLERVVMASPRHFRVVDPINSAQEEHFSSAPPVGAKLLEEQAAFVRVLVEAGVDVVWASEQPESPFQLNTRDVGAVIGSEFVLGRMRYPIRAREPDAITELLAADGIAPVRLPAGTFEGGDVLIDGDTVYLGLSQRTSEDAARDLAEHLRGRGIALEPVVLDPSVLHLDVVLNLVSPGVALAYLPGLPDGIPESIAARYDVLEITEEENASLGTNAFAVAPDTVVADARSPRIARLLESRGVRVVTIDYESTAKIGGSFRCMTLPLRRRELRG
jgi:N-dimethylarginine dimethylaminohydrolase